MSIYCDGSGERIFRAAGTVRCPFCGAFVAVTRQGHMNQHMKPQTEGAQQQKRPAGPRR